MCASVDHISGGRCLYYAKGTHRQKLPSRLGDAVIHSSLTVHWSEANRSQRSRQAITYFYWAASCQGDEGGANSIRR